MKKFKNHLKIFIFISCSVFIFYSLYNNSEIFDDLYQNKYLFYILVIINVVLVNITSLRGFLFIKASVGYLYSFIDWSKLHFESKLLNHAISFTGIAYKGVQLKKRSINYTKFIAISFFLLGLYISITLILILFALLFLQEIYMISIVALIVLLILIIFFSPLILKIFLNYLIRLNKIKKYMNNIKNLITILDNIYLKKKTILISVVITVIFCLIEFTIFYLICSIFLDNINISFIIGLFGANFIINRIPFTSSIPGVNEITLGIVFLPFGFFFTEGIVIALSRRILLTLSNLINCGIFFILSFYDKNKFINQ